VDSVVGFSFEYTPGLQWIHLPSLGAKTSEAMNRSQWAECLFPEIYSISFLKMTVKALMKLLCEDKAWKQCFLF
jgi:hypothetical protein